MWRRGLWDGAVARLRGDIAFAVREGFGLRANTLVQPDGMGLLRQRVI
jgi:hypothetical protein